MTRLDEYACLFGAEVHHDPYLDDDIATVRRADGKRALYSLKTGKLLAVLPASDPVKFHWRDSSK